MIALASLVTTLLAPPASGDWTDLLMPDAFRRVDARWVRAAGVALTPDTPTRLTPAGIDPAGPVWVNGPGHIANLATKESFGDCEITLEFLIAKKSNAGIKFHGLYEIQILDTADKPGLTGNSLGGIYPRATMNPRYHHIDKGIAPRVNAAKPAGEWQTLEVTWSAPRFDAEGKRTRPGRVERAVLNGQVIHEAVDVFTPTGANWVKADTPEGPLMLQADHGPVAFRAFKVRRR